MSTYRYATRQKFSGQALSQGRTVLVKVSYSLLGPDAANVFSVDEKDIGHALVIGAKDPVTLAPEKFVSTETEDDLLAMKSGEWTWPPRV